MDVSNLRYRVLFEPRGFIRFLQFILSIVAFATTSGFNETVSYYIKCAEETAPAQDLVFPVSYPFRLDSTGNEFKDCKNQSQELRLEGDLSPSSQWFVCVGVLSFLLSLASLVFYVAYESAFRLTHERLVTIADFAATVIFAFFWLTAASAWAWGSNQVKLLTSFEYVNKIYPYSDNCKLQDVTCRNSGVLQSSKMSASVAFGFLNFFLWVSNVWFVYKESPFHQEPNKEMDEKSAPAAPAPPQNAM